MAEQELYTCANCGQSVSEVDFLARCTPCFKAYVMGDHEDKRLLFQSTNNPHNKKETKAYVERLEGKRWTPQGTDHRYVKRSYFHGNTRNA